MNTSNAIHPDMSLGSLAVQIPGATAVFRKFKLDFCCNGHQSLADACASRTLDLAAVISELGALQDLQPMPAAPSTGELIDHILQRYHAEHRQQLPELIAMARRVEAVHRDHPLVRRACQAIWKPWSKNCWNIWPRKSKSCFQC